MVGTIFRIAGPFIIAKGMSGSRMYELVKVGKAGIIGEVIRLEGETAAIQAYEETAGIKTGEEVQGTGRSLSVELGPGLIGQIYDGIQRIPPALDREKRWHFQPMVKKGTRIVGGDVVGTVQETVLVEHRILVPPFVKGVVEKIVSEGEYNANDSVAEVRTEEGVDEVHVMHTWPIRQPRPFKTALLPDVPLLTGQRIIDAFFPLAKGG